MSEYDTARLKNQLAAAALADVAAQKRRAAVTNPDRDASAENLSRVKRAGDGPWTPTHGDATAARNTGK